MLIREIRISKISTMQNSVLLADDRGMLVPLKGTPEEWVKFLKELGEAVRLPAATEKYVVTYNTHVCPGCLADLRQPESLVVDVQDGFQLPVGYFGFLDSEGVLYTVHTLNSQNHMGTRCRLCAQSLADYEVTEAKPLDSKRMQCPRCGSTHCYHSQYRDPVDGSIQSCTAWCEECKYESSDPTEFVRD